MLELLKSLVFAVIMVPVVMAIILGLICYEVLHTPADNTP